MGRLMYGAKPRVCYDNGNSKTGKEVYELHAACTCTKCEARKKLRRNSLQNQATATTMDIDKIKDVMEFLKNWTCEDGSRELETVYFKF